jgi:hypothetical protein
MQRPRNCFELKKRVINLHPRPAGPLPSGKRSRMLAESSYGDPKLLWNAIVRNLEGISFVPIQIQEDWRTKIDFGRSENFQSGSINKKVFLNRQ